jgi:hypothetical protein
MRKYLRCAGFSDGLYCGGVFATVVKVCEIVSCIDAPSAGIARRARKRRARKTNSRAAMPSAIALPHGEGGQGEAAQPSACRRELLGNLSLEVEGPRRQLGVTRLGEERIEPAAVIDTAERVG